MAIYKKPSKLKYTDMAIFIDKNIYREDLTEEEENKIFEYLYYLANMLARKANYFKKAEYYEDFAIYFATSVYFRLRNKKQYDLSEETGEPKLDKIKSCLNYMKNVIYFRKTEFEQEFYSQVFSPGYEDDEDIFYDTNYTFYNKLVDSMDDINAIDFDLCLGSICQTAKNFLKQIPYRNNKLVWNNIYLSCILTLLNILTLSNKTLERIDNLKYDIQNRPRAVDNLYKDTPENLVILYHLDNNMRDYIWVLTQEIKKLLAKDLSLSMHTYIPSSSILNLVALADINIEEYNDYND